MIVLLGLSHHSSPVTLRERFAFAEARVPAALRLLRDSGAAEEAVILSTCNRVEIYAVTSLDMRQAFADDQLSRVRLFYTLFQLLVFTMLLAVTTDNLGEARLQRGHVPGLLPH